MPTKFTFGQLRDAVRECTSYDLSSRIDDELGYVYVLIDPFGDQDGDPFYDLVDVEDFIRNNSQVDEYLNEVAA